MNLLNLKERISGKHIELSNVIINKIITYSNGSTLYLKVCKAKVQVQADRHQLVPVDSTSLSLKQ